MRQKLKVAKRIPTCAAVAPAPRHDNIPRQSAATQPDQALPNGVATPLCFQDNAAVSDGGLMWCCWSHQYASWTASMIAHMIGLTVLGLWGLHHAMADSDVTLMATVAEATLPLEDDHEMEPLDIQPTAFEESPPEADPPEPPKWDDESVEVAAFEMNEPTAIVNEFDVNGLGDLMHELPGGNGRSTDGAAMSSGQVEELQSRLAREGAKTGDVQVSLMWNNLNDLDLHVRAPSGEKVSFHHPRSQCGGALDVDMNVTRLSMTPVENVHWPAGAAPRGQYIVYVNHFKNNGMPDPTRFAVSVKVGDRPLKTYAATLRYGEPPRKVCSFRL